MLHVAALAGVEYVLGVVCVIVVLRCTRHDSVALTHHFFTQTARNTYSRSDCARVRLQSAYDTHHAHHVRTR